MKSALLPYLLIFPSVIYSLLTFICIRGFFARKTPDPGFRPALTLIKPLKGGGEGLYSNLQSFCSQDYPEFQIILVVKFTDDPAYPVATRIAASYPNLDISVIADPALHGANGKVSNLINAYALVKHDIIVISDSDIFVESDYLQRVAGYFHDPAVGVVTSPYRGRGFKGGALFESLGYSAEMMPNVLVAERLEGMSFALGASMAVRRRALEEIGGFQALADYLADDYMLGNLVSRAGWQVVLAKGFANIVPKVESVADIMKRQLRWGRTVRISRGGGFFLSALTYPYVAIIAVLVLAGFSVQTLIAIVILYLFRGTVLCYYSSRFARDGLLPRYLWLLPLRDLLTFVIWLLAFTDKNVEWGGELYRVQIDGRMVKVDQ